VCLSVGGTDSPAWPGDVTTRRERRQADNARLNDEEPPSAVDAVRRVGLSSSSSEQQAVSTQQQPARMHTPRRRVSTGRT
jgi:hypothetical protein